MGLWDFAVDVGRKIFDTDAEAADNIRQHIETRMTNVKDLDVQFDDGVVTVCGECSSAADKELIPLIVGDIKGVSSVNIDGVKAPESKPEEREEVVYYVVESGDTLGAIAQRFLGKASAYMQIFEANSALLDDPNKIYPGQKLRIPTKGS